MAQFIDKLPKYKTQKLLEFMSIKPNEDILQTTEISSYGGKMYVVHGKNGRGERVESIYTDFFIEKIYNCTPSEFDQDRFQNAMKLLCGPEYSKQVIIFNRKFRKYQDRELKEIDFVAENNEEFE